MQAQMQLSARPHVLQGIELYEGRYIAYSLGNFAFGGNSLARRPETAIRQLRFRSVNSLTCTIGASVVPCLITSSTSRNKDGVRINDYQPALQFGRAAQHITAPILKRSSSFKYRLHVISSVRKPSSSVALVQSR